MYRCSNNRRNDSRQNHNLYVTNLNNDAACDLSNNDKNDSDYECGFSKVSSFPNEYMYGQSYVPIQTMNETFKPEIGLKMGTIFPELVSPYVPGQSMEEDAYLRRVTTTTNQGGGMA